MKKIFLFLVSVCISFSVFPQKLNDVGLKMVKEFIIDYYNKEQDLSSVEKFSFGYNNEDKMISLNVYKNGEHIESYLNENGEITTYENCLTEQCEYKFKQDRYGNITSFEFIMLDNDKLKTPCWKRTFLFDYTFENNCFRLKQLKYKGNNYNVIKKEFIPNDKFIISNVDNIDGLYTCLHESYCNFVSDQEHPNDTNMSFFGILDKDGLNTSDILINHLLLTEWINIRSPYFPKFIGNYRYYSYKYDDKGNIIKIEERFCKNNKLIKSINIEYVD